MHGLARPAKSMVPPGMPTHDPSAWKYDTNPQKAKQMLAAAGHPDGFKSSIDVLIGRPEDEQAATLIQASFREIGVDVEVSKLAEAEYQEKRNNGSSPMQIVEFYSWVDRPLLPPVLEHALGEHVHELLPLLEPEGRQADPDRGLYEPTRRKREAIEPQAQKLIIEDAPWAWLFARDFFAPVAKQPAGLPAVARPEPALLLEPLS